MDDDPSLSTCKKNEHDICSRKYFISYSNGSKIPPFAILVILPILGFAQTYSCWENKYHYQLKMINGPDKYAETLPSINRADEISTVSWISSQEIDLIVTCNNPPC